MGAAADVIRRLTDEVYLEGNLDVIDQLVAEDFVSHDPPPGFSTGRDGMHQLAELVVDAFSDRRTELDEVIETTDGRIVQNWLMVASHTGEFGGLPPSGQQVRVRGIDIFRCESGRVVEHWGAVDITDVIEKAQAGS